MHSLILPNQDASNSELSELFLLSLLHPTVVADERDPFERLGKHHRSRSTDSETSVPFRGQGDLCNLPRGLYTAEGGEGHHAPG